MFDWVPLFGNIRSSENKKLRKSLKIFKRNFSPKRY